MNDLTQCTIGTTIIGVLATDAEQRGLTEQEFKDKFDQFGKLFVEFFNLTHLTDLKTKIEAALNESISSVILTGTSNPTTSTVGTLGQLYKNTVTGKAFQCTSIVSTTYTWIELATTETYQLQASDLRNGWAKISDASYGDYISRNGNVVTINGLLQSGTTAAGTAILVLPARFRPKAIQYIPLLVYGAGTTTEYIRCKIDLDGSITINTPITLTYLSLNCSFTI